MSGAKTSEFVVLAASVFLALVLAFSKQHEAAHDVVWLAAAYILSRGIAKRGGAA